MTTTRHHFIEPLDVLFLRGNKLFGDPGSFGQSLVPPWPSTLAGALRSHLLALAGFDPASFARGETAHPALGTPAAPGPFTLVRCTLGRRQPDGTVEPLQMLPADLDVAAAGAPPAVRLLQPLVLPSGIAGSTPLPMLPVLAEAERSKSAGPFWLTARGWKDYLAAKPPAAGELLPPADLWKLDPRIGVGLQSDTRRADDGKLFSTEAVTFCDGIGFAVDVGGAELPDGIVRLGGDGRAARLSQVRLAAPEPDWDAIVAARRARLILTNPGLFTGGWLPTGSEAVDAASGARFALRGVHGRIVCASVPRAQVVSGFDLARWVPKPAQRAVPAGAVYWLDDLDASPEALRDLCESGLWDEPAHDPARRAEGFNRCAIGVWS